ncbi:MAG TPA: DNA primase [Chitinophagales bacterium]|nr:DNA primase [Chitinophagales bacterium]MBP6154372.1 DNA primase [Chitinophagales bacterium]HQV78789.1 DNA primase [Chitinophagales bacterium]HQW79155.1 DNA primase [Chitinophagales bacterium]
MITRDTIAKILDTARIEDVVGDFVNLKKNGSILKGLCPFHNERTPSFVVNPNKNIFKCFGCGVGGDSVSFVMELEKMTFPEALRYLAQKYHIEVEEVYTSNEDVQEKNDKESLLIALNYAAKFYQTQLTETEDGKAIGLSYFKERGFLEDTISTFQLGYAPDSFDAFYHQAIKDGFNPEVLLKAGLIKEKNGKHYDFFRDRVMFPISNVSGKVVAFGGRMLKSSKPENPNVYNPKYINTAETDVYHKSQILYGISQAKSDIRKLDVCYLVEGYTDVISLYQAGIKNVVASSGTALTKEQVQLVKRFTENIVILYDGDAAGIKAALRGLDIVLEQGMNVKLVLLPDGDDPDSFVKRNGTDATLEFIKNSQQDFILFKAAQGIEISKNDPIKKSEMIKDIVESIAKIDDNIKRQLYIKQCAGIVDVPEAILINETNKIRSAHFRKSREISDEDKVAIDNELKIEVEQSQSVTKVPPFFYQEKDIIRILIEHGDLPMNEEHSVAEYVIFELVDVEFKTDVFGKIIQLYMDAYRNEQPLAEVKNLNNIQEEDVKNVLVEMMSSPYEISENWMKKHEIVVTDITRTYKSDVVSAMLRFRYYKMGEIMKLIAEKIKQSDLSGNYEENIASLLKHMEMKKKQQDLAKEIQSVIHPS